MKGIQNAGVENRDLLSQAMRGRFPMKVESLEAYVHPFLNREFSDLSEVVSLLEQLVGELETKLTLAVK